MALNTKTKDYGSNQSPAMIGTSNMAEFNRLRHLISDSSQRIRRNNVQMQKMVSQIGGPTDNLELRDKLHKLQHQTNEMAKETNRNLQSLATLNISPNDSKPVKEQLTSEFTTVLKDFQALQRSQMTEERRMLMKKKKIDQLPQQQLRQVSKHANLIDTGDGVGDDDELRNDDQTFGQQQQQQQQQASVTKEDVEFLENTEGQIRQLETDISDINQVFKDLSLLIHEQGEVVDSIEANTESATYNVSRGTHKLMLAKSYRDKIRKRKFCIVAIATVVVAIFLLIIIIPATKSS